MKRKWFAYMLLIILFVVAPIIVEYIWSIPSGKGDWLSFWGSYLGIIPSGLIAYFVAKYQIDREHEFMLKEKDKEYRIMVEEKNQEYLPYFNIKNNRLVFSSMRENLPIQNVQLAFYDKDDQLINNDKCKDWCNLGHLFPSSYEELPIGSEHYSRLDVLCSLVNGREIFFTYGNNVQGAHFFRKEGSSFEPYVYERTHKGQTIAWHRVNQVK